MIPTMGSRPLSVDPDVAFEFTVLKPYGPDSGTGDLIMPRPSFRKGLANPRVPGYRAVVSRVPISPTYCAEQSWRAWYE